MLKEDSVQYDPETGRMRTGPRQVFVELTARCNLACVTCSVDYGRLRDGPEKDMPLSTVERLLPWLEQAQSINLNFVGEPLLHSRFREVLRLLGESRAKVHFNTNGTCLTDDLCRELVRRPVGSVVVSVDGVESNHPIRGVSYQRIRDNILRLVQARNGAGRRLPVIGIAYTLMRRNLPELPRVLEDLLLKGVDVVHVQPLVIFYESLRRENIYDAPGLEATLRRCRRIAESSGSRLTVFRSNFAEDERHVSLGQDLPQLGATSTRYGCMDPFYEVKVHHDGLVESCSYGLANGFNVNEQPLAEIWNSTWYRSLRSRLCRGDFVGRCECCPYLHGSAENQISCVRPGVRHSMDDRFREGL